MSGGLRARVCARVCGGWRGAHLGDAALAQLQRGGFADAQRLGVGSQLALARDAQHLVRLVHRGAHGELLRRLPRDGRHALRGGAARREVRAPVSRQRGAPGGRTLAFRWLSSDWLRDALYSHTPVRLMGSVAAGPTSSLPKMSSSPNPTPSMLRCGWRPAPGALPVPAPSCRAWRPLASPGGSARRQRRDRAPARSGPFFTRSGAFAIGRLCRRQPARDPAEAHLAAPRGGPAPRGGLT